MPAYALTIFLGAFLLFQVQPLIAKYILPWFGGGPGVWTTCMLFFQLVLLAGYAYAHLLSHRLSLRAQAATHLALLAIALALLPITPGEWWKPVGNGNPVLRILGLLAATLGLPYLVLSAAGPLLQHWFSRANPGASPYRLYALSNVGSLLALVSYPVFFETHFSRKTQAGIWSAGLWIYAFCCAWCAMGVGRLSPKSSVQSPGSEIRNPKSEIRNAGASWLDRLLWLALPACASVLLLAITNKICQDVAVIPFLWVLPLGLYLFSFIICFDSPRWYHRLPFALGLVAAAAGVCWALFKGTDASIYKQVGIYSGALFLCSMVCHGELFRLRPSPERLTGFYLMIAIGGALGGLFVAVAAPLLFNNYYELHWGLLLCVVLFLVACARDRDPARQNEWRWLACVLPLLVFAGLDWWVGRLGEHSKNISKGWFAGLRVCLWGMLLLMVFSWLARRKHRTFENWRLLTCLWLALGIVALATALGVQARKADADRVYTSRNFYGVLTLYEHRRREPTQHHLLLQHGRITHGLQFIEASQAAWATTYYGADSGVGVALRALPAGSRRIGLVGLGTGTLTAYGRAGDYVRVYEINPAVRRLAETRFTYLGNCPGKVEIAVGDARLSMEREPPQRLDLLALDAFSSDAIPVHLLTREAFAVYERHLKTNAIIAIHISNHYLDLEPVVCSLAERLNYKVAIIDYDETEEEWWLYSSTWVLLTRSEELKNSPIIRRACRAEKKTAANVPLWTDDFASLFQILK